MFPAVSYALSHRILWIPYIKDSFCIIKTRYPRINTQIVKLENITKIPHLLYFRRSKELHRRWLLHMRVSTNASVLYQFSQAVNRKKLMMMMMMMMKNREVCEPFGDVVEVRMVRHSETNEGKGFAFMAFRSKNVAQKAIEELHNKDFKV
ncbi:putative RNA recognition motif domain, nucleotide-binding alpha-beta plait domain superfamily [Helianthus anomalus]